MASAAVAAQAGPKNGLAACPLIQYPEYLSMTFKRGAVIVTNGSGYAIEATSPNPTNIIGIADAPGQNLSASGTPNSAAPGNVIGTTATIPAIPSMTFEMNLDDHTSTGHTLAQTDLNVAYGLYKDATTGIWYVDYASTGASARVVVTGFRDAVGTACGRVYCQFKSGTTVFA